MTHIPATFGQELLWVHQRTRRRDTGYVICRALSITGPLDVEALRRAFYRLIERHDALRTRIVYIRGRLYLEIDDRPSESAALVTEAAAPGDDVVERVLSELVPSVLDLGRGPLIRARLVNTSTDGHVLVIVVHHAIVDATSVNTIFAELAAFYNHDAHGVGLRLAPLRSTFADFARRERARFDRETSTDPGLRFWRSQLTGIRPCLPAASGGVAAAVDDPVASTAVRLDIAERGLSAASRRLRSTPFIIGLTAFVTALNSVTGSEDLVVATPATLRGPSAAPALVGHLVNILPVRIRLPARPTPADALTEVRQAVLRALPHSAVPFSRVLKDFGSESTGLGELLFQIFFGYQDAEPERHDFHGLIVRRVELGDRATPAGTGARSGLSLECVPSGTSLECRLDRNPAIVSGTTADALLHKFVETMRSLIFSEPVPTASASTASRPV